MASAVACDTEREIQCARCLPELERLAAIVELRGDRQLGANDALEVIARIPERVAGRQIRADRHGAQAIVAIQLPGAGLIFEPRQIR
jgi:hypothetical protein